MTNFYCSCYSADRPLPSVNISLQMNVIHACLSICKRKNPVHDKNITLTNYGRSIYSVKSTLSVSTTPFSRHQAGGEFSLNLACLSCVNELVLRCVKVRFIICFEIHILVTIQFIPKVLRFHGLFSFSKTGEITRLILCQPYFRLLLF